MAQPIMRILAGTAYGEGSRIVPLVATGMLLLGLQERYQAVFWFGKKTIFIAYAIVGSGVLNLFLNLWFVPIHGYWAAAITTLISYGLLLFSMIVLSRRFLIWQFPFKTLARVVLASTLMGVAVHVVSTKLASWAVLAVLSGCCAGAVSYAVLLVLLGELQPVELQRLMAWKSRFVRKERPNQAAIRDGV